MIRKPNVAILLAILAVSAFAQDAKPVLANASQTMGAQNVTSVDVYGHSPRPQVQDLTELIESSISMKRADWLRARAYWQGADEGH